MRAAWRCAVVLAVLVVACAAGISAPRANPAKARPRTLVAHRTPYPIVALGDSVPSGAACDCTPYPQLSATALSSLGVHDVSVTNLAVGGYTTADVIDQVMHDPQVISDVQQSRLTEVEIGANDIGYSTTCGTDAACYAPMVPAVEDNLLAIVQRVHRLTAGHQSLVVLLDYWSDWLGGRYAQARGPAYVATAAAVTDDVSNAIKAVAEQTGSAYVDLRAAFKGPDYTDDETAWLADDGDHPNAAGHRLIASAVEEVVQAHLQRPPP